MDDALDLDRVRQPAHERPGDPALAGVLGPKADDHRFAALARIGDELPIRMVMTHDDVTVVRQAEQRARRAQRLEAIGTLAGGIAHDLNNALTPILMGLDLLRAAAPDHADTIEMMLGSANYGAEMLKQLLTFARGAEGRRMPLRAQSLLEDVERIARGTFPKSIRLHARTQPDLPLVHGDPTQLHQVLLNLCVNARDAMPNGGTLTLLVDAVTVDEAFARTVAGARSGEFVRLSVQDTGVGIGAEDLDRIFDPFFTTKAVNQGTGLGLSTALGIVKAHDGFFQVGSEPGRGSIFSCYLPAVHVVSIDEAAPKDDDNIPGAGQLILVVEDEAAIRQLYRVVLGQLGFRVTVAGDGAAGLEQVERYRAELAAIITDVRMPTMDGLAFIRALYERGIDLPLAVASGRIEDAQVAELDALGVTTRLSKPFTRRRLQAALRQMLGRDMGVGSR